MVDGVMSMNINQHDIVYKVLLGDRDNINIVHEIFRQVSAWISHAPYLPTVILQLQATESSL